ncbi:MAG TPA: hypothetical protein VGN90_18160 [Pyrinomonadaceae bacterium]|nr:hypothetical protein [Pyrinomonadaceae bacterium]
MKTMIKWFCPALLLGVSLVSSGQTPPKKASPAKSVTGHYVMRREEFRNRLNVQQLADGRVKFDLLALWVSHYNPENVHNGTAQGIVNRGNGVAVYEADGCRLKLEFLPTKIRITQSEGVGDCGFGANVTATGSYRRVDSKKPRFDF